MKEVTLHIEESKVKAFLEFIKTLDYVKLESPEKKAIEELKSSLKQVKHIKEGKLPKESIKGKSKTQVLEGIREAVEEVNQVKAGKKKAKPLSEFLNEL